MPGEGARPPVSACGRGALGARGIRTGPEFPRAPPAAVGLTRRRAIWVGGAASGLRGSGLAAWRLWPGSGEVRSLAVLPFQNAQGDEEIDYLCDGVTESLIRQLATMPSLKVTSLSTVLNFKGQAIDPREAGRQLALDTVLAGTLTRETGRLLITAELVDVESGTDSGATNTTATLPTCSACRTRSPARSWMMACACD